MYKPLAHVSMVVVLTGCGLKPAPAGGNDVPAEPTPSSAPAVAPAPATAPAPNPADSTVGACGDGVVIVDFWEGEWPGPVVHVTTAVDVLSRSAPCVAEPDTTCRLEPGVYHPWGEGTGHVTVRGIDRYRLNSAVELSVPNGAMMTVAAGSEVAVTGYAGEGYCVFRVEGRELHGECPGMSDEATWTDLDDPQVATRQLFQGACGSWVETDAALFARPEITEGTHTEYGKVGPAAR